MSIPLDCAASNHGILTVPFFSFLVKKQFEAYVLSLFSGKGGGETHKKPVQDKQGTSHGGPQREEKPSKEDVEMPPRDESTVKPLAADLVAQKGKLKPTEVRR